MDPQLATAVTALREVILAGERYRRAASTYLCLDLSGSQAVSYLYSRGPMGQSELGSLLGFTTASITALTDRLERDGIARRRPHPTDRRRTVVELTEHGEQAARSTGQWLAGSFDHIDRNALPAVIEALSRIAEDLSRQAVDLTGHPPASSSGSDKDL